MISPTRIAEITALAEAATPGPWYTLDPPWLPSDANTSILAESPDPHVARFICDFDLWTLDEETDKVSERPDADAAFIAAARTAVPELLDRIAALEAERAAQQPRPDASVDGLAGELAALDCEEACLKGTPMIPIHRDTLKRILAALTTREAVVEDDATVERVAREVLFCVEMARTEVVNPVNGARPYSYVTFAGARIEFQQLDRDIKYRAGSPVYDAATDKAAAQAQRINDILFDVAKRAAIRALAAKEVE